MGPRWFYGLAGSVFLIVALWWGRSFLVPIVVALILFVLLNALISRIASFQVAGRNIPRPAATALGIAVVALGLVFFTAVLTQQVNAAVEAMPRYLDRLDELLEAAGRYVGEDVSSQLAGAVRDINLTERIPTLLGSAGAMLTAIALVVIYLAFMFAERPIFWTKLSLVLNRGPEDRAHVILRAINHSIERYFWVKLLTSALTGGAAYAVIKPLGLDFAETWALVIFFLNFIPNIGSAVATLLPTLVALVQFDSFTPFLVVGLGVTSIQLVVGNVLEPALMGRTLNLSPLVIILSLTFWGAIWGVVGMFLSVPIMVTVLIVAAQFPAWRPLAVMLSNDGDIPPLANE